MEREYKQLYQKSQYVEQFVLTDTQKKKSRQEKEALVSQYLASHEISKENDEHYAYFIQFFKKRANTIQLFNFLKGFYSSSHAKDFREQIVTLTRELFFSISTNIYQDSQLTFRQKLYAISGRSKKIETEALHINSNLLTYQNRDRLYWTNIKGITMPQDAKLNFQDFKLKTLPRVEHIIRHNKFHEDKLPLTLTKYEINKIAKDNHWAYEEMKKFKPSMTRKEFVDELHAQLWEATQKVMPFRIKMWDACLNKGPYASKNLDLPTSTKCGALTLKNDRTPSTSGLIAFGDFYRYLTRIEMSKAQGIPYSYTKDFSYNQANNALGDAWSTPIIAHCLSFMK